MSDYFHGYDGDDSPPPYGYYSDDEYGMGQAHDDYRYYDYDDNDGDMGPPRRGLGKSGGGVVSKKCRTCGNTGHDSRTCAINKGFKGKNKKPKETAPPPPPPPPPPPVQKRTAKPAEEKACGACREIGHDRRSCPKLLGVSQQQKQEDMVTVVKKFMETMASTSSAPASTKAKSKTKKEEPSTKASSPSKSTASSSRGKAATASKQSAQTAKRSKTVNPLGASGSRGGAGVTKKSSAAAAKKKSAPAAAKSKTTNKSMNFTINWG
ncbi:hypothetical protein TWF481_010032 [Arthrobotrys musiformis]|uniref:CCHC-type domain-containing protein n=1 Tax=Arthrobotrys musiformis TaxID=47236 RepID=A0AAV9W0X2_9PEZI